MEFLRLDTQRLKARRLKLGNPKTCTITQSSTFAMPLFLFRIYIIFSRRERIYSLAFLFISFYIACIFLSRRFPKRQPFVSDAFFRRANICFLFFFFQRHSFQRHLHSSNISCIFFLAYLSHRFREVSVFSNYMFLFFIFFCFTRTFSVIQSP